MDGIKMAVIGPSGELTSAMTAEYAASFSRKPLDPRLYSLEQCMAAAGKLPPDHPSFWEGTAEPWEASTVRVGPEEPETMGQARKWDKAKSLYLRDGLCHPCAAQAAWGHSIGFGNVGPPCAACLPVVETFPVEKVSPWRGYERGDRRPSDGPSRGVRGQMNVPSALLAIPARAAFLGTLREAHRAALDRGEMVAHLPDCRCSPCSSCRPAEYARA